MDFSINNIFDYWPQQNPTQLHQQLLHRNKVTVLSTVSSYAVMGIYFFENEDGLVTTYCYVGSIHVLEIFGAQKPQSFPQMIKNGWFKQDGSMAHSARISMAVVRQLFNFATH